MVAVRGVAPDDLDPDQTQHLCAVLGLHGELPVYLPGTLPLGRQVAEGTTDCLREMGLTVDRSSIVLARRRADDHSKVERILRRPMGPADVTILALDDPLAAARLAGTASHGYREAQARTDDHLAAVAGYLQQAGVPPSVWMLMEGPVQAVHRVFSVASFVDRLPSSLQQQIEVRVDDGAVLFRCASRPAARALGKALAAHPLGNAGRVFGPAAPPPETTLHPGESLVVAAEGVAFGEQRVRARLQFGGGGVAALPHSKGSLAQVSVSGITARLVMAAAERLDLAVRSQEVPMAEVPLEEWPDLGRLLNPPPAVPDE